MLANAVNKYGVDRIALINLVEPPSREQVNFTNFAMIDLWDTLCGLVEGVYRWKDRKGKSHAVPVPEAKNNEAYKKLRDKIGEAHLLDKVRYKFLREDIERLRELYGADSIVDLTGTPKRIAIDILVACLAIGLSRVMLFELNKLFDSEVESLYHNLDEADYVVYQLARIGFGETNWITWLLVIAIAVIGLVGGVAPLMDAWGGIQLMLNVGKRKREI